MTLEEALYSHLASATGLEIYPLVVPQDVGLAAVAYTRISGPRILAHDGPTGLAEARIQFTCIAASYSDAKSTAASIRAALDGFSGLMGGSGGVTVEECSVENEADGYGPVGETQTVRLDMFILYIE